jgi:hypothetical protein
MGKSKLIKGQWYWELQVLWLVFMWLHDLSHKPTSIRGLRVGRFYVWRDSAWGWEMKHRLRRFLRLVAAESVEPRWMLCLAALAGLGDGVLGLVLAPFRRRPGLAVRFAQWQLRRCVRMQRAQRKGDS